ncbi:hypothetical protein [Paenibacillus tarimensis]
MMFPAGSVDAAVSREGIVMKEHYYVSISSGTIEKQRPEADYMEIEATPEELEQLQRLIVREEADDRISHFKAQIPYKSNDKEQTATDFSDDIRDLYAMIYKLGTESTKQFIRDNRLIEKLQDTDYDYPGYETSKGGG